MRRNFLSIVTIFTVVIMLTACNGKTYKLSSEDNGRTLEMKSGETLLISIDGNPTTGYTWEVDSVDETILQLAGEPDYSTSSESKPGMTGVGGTYKFTFNAVSTGTATLKLKYWRTFEPENPPVETFEVEIVVK